MCLALAACPLHAPHPASTHMIIMHLGSPPGADLAALHAQQHTLAIARHAVMLHACTCTPVGSFDTCLYALSSSSLCHHGPWLSQFRKGLCASVPTTRTALTSFNLIIAAGMQHAFVSSLRPRSADQDCCTESQNVNVDLMQDLHSRELLLLY